MFWFYLKSKYRQFYGYRGAAIWRWILIVLTKIRRKWRIPFFEISLNFRDIEFEKYYFFICVLLFFNCFFYIIIFPSTYNLQTFKTRVHKNLRLHLINFPFSSVMQGSFEIHRGCIILVRPFLHSISLKKKKKKK